MAGKKTHSAPKVKMDAKALIALVVCLALSAGTYFLFTEPMRSAAADMNAQVQAADAELASNTQRISDVTSGRATGADKLLSQAQDLDRKLPTTVDRVSLVATIPNLAKQYRITINQMDPSTATVDGAGNLQSQAFTMSATGRTEDVTAWIAALQTYPATLSVAGLALVITDGEAVATFTLNAFYVSTETLPTVG